jgi:hypothetical protein
MNCRIATTEDFDRRIKAFAKKYHSFKADVVALKKELLVNPTMGVEVVPDTRKVRMAKRILRN